MSSLSLPKVLTQRKASTVETERENFERAQSVSLAKAINTQETPVKEKHVRSAIIGSFQEKGARTFWSVVLRLPLQGNPIVCWKFCHVLHKLLREGHPNAFEDTYRNKKFLAELQKLWGLLRDGYGKLIGCYCKLLLAKLDFHRRNPRFPGNLQVTDEQLDDIAERDVNVYFQLSCEMFDYMDEILHLQIAVFGSLDMSRSNSMTNSGQCRLAPLIPCIQDSSLLYDYTVKLLFKLHSSLPSDTLVGHRDRFLNQYKKLQQFYLSSSNLQYFKYLIQVPLLPENPPNFLISSDLSSHISPVVILHEPAQSDGPEDTVDMNLVDVSAVSPVKFDDSFGSNDRDSVASSPVPSNHLLNEQLMEKDRIIHQLVRELEELRLEFQKAKVEYERVVNDLKKRLKISEDQCAEHEKLIEQLRNENEQLTQERDAVIDSEDAAKLAEKAKAQEEKFQKMKEIYGKLREEHIVLIRTKAESDKQLASAKATLEDSKQAHRELEQKFRISENEKNLVVEKFQTSSKGSEDKLKSLIDDKNLLEKQNKDISDQLQSLKTTLELTEQMLKDLKNEKQNLEVDINNVKSNFDSELKTWKEREAEAKWKLLVDALTEGGVVVENALGEFDNPTISMVNCTPEYLLHQIETLKKSLGYFKEGCEVFQEDNLKIETLLRTVGPMSHHVGVVLLCGKTTSQASPNIEQGEELALFCKKFGSDVLKVLDTVKHKGDTGTCISEIYLKLDTLSTMTEQLIPNMSGDDKKKLGDMVGEELAEMDRAIEEAAQRIADLLSKTKEGDSGIKLEVNGKILDACTTLMQAIRILVQRSRDLQEEITNHGRGSASVTEFYNRNHRWTEGLISAAKVVGLSAKFLVDAADKVVMGNAKFEELVVASQEIAAATAQLVVASKVKAERGSEKLKNLSTASRSVTDSTGNVVATAKSCAQLIEETEVLDFSKLTLHQAKLLEMESQVRVLELENSLVKERVRLAGLRKRHYHMAGASEGWEESDIKN